VADPPLIDRLIRRDQWIVAACLIAVAALAWLWLLEQSGIGGFAGMNGEPMAAMGMGAPVVAPRIDTGAYFAGAFIMWALMMTAMMLPSAAPMMLFYARFARGVKAQGAVLAPTALFVAVYLAVWTAFSLAAAAAQTGLVEAGAVSAARLTIGDGRLAGGLLIGFGLYQLTPLKRACLDTCRSPLSFLTRLWRPGLSGAVRLGLYHGAYCVGCCWPMMALLFVVGVMSLTWVGALALIVLIEKTAPMGSRIGVGLGMAAIVAGILMLLGVAPSLHLFGA